MEDDELELKEENIEIEEDEEDEEENLNVSIPVLKDESIKIFQDEDWSKITNKNINKPSPRVSPQVVGGPTRAQALRGAGTRAPQSVKGEEIVRKSTLYVCIDQTAFMAQLQKEQQIEIRRQTIIQEQPPDLKKISILETETENEEEIKEEPKKSRRGRFGAPPPARKLATSSSLSIFANAPQVYQELINTEKSYIKDLLLICEVFLEPIRENFILQTFEIVTLFANLEELIPVNQALLKDLEAAGVDGVGDVFQKHADRFKVYGSYCSNQPNIRDKISEYKEQYPLFSKLLRTAFRNPACRKQDLESLLISPLQRLCKYPLLLKELMKYTTKNLNEVDDEHGICHIGNGKSEITRVNSIQKWSQVACGGLHFVALSFGNSIYVWGKGREGQLGLGNGVHFREDPTLVSLSSSIAIPVGIQKVACGPLQTAAITDSGELYLWGLLETGPVYEPTKRQFPNQNKVLCVTFGPTCSFVLIQSSKVTGNEVWTWGISNKGMLGLGQLDKTKVPTEIPELRGKRVVDIRAGELHVSAITDSGEVYLWGDNTDNVLGIGRYENSKVPQLVVFLLGKEVIKVTCGYRHSLALTKKGEVYSWGYARHGVLGHGNEILKSVPEVIKVLQGHVITDISSGGMINFALEDNGNLYSWGEGRGFKTGQNGEEDVLVPTVIKSMSGFAVKQISSGSLGGIVYFENFSQQKGSYIQLEDGLQCFTKVVDFVNENVKKVENIAKLLDVSNRLTNSDKYKLIEDNTIYIREGPLTVNGKGKYVFLFSDKVIFCRKVRKSKLFKCYALIPLSVCVLSEIEGNPTAFELGEIGNKLYVIECASSLKKNQWYKAFNEPIEKLSGEMSNRDKRRSLHLLRQATAPKRSQVPTLRNAKPKESPVGRLRASQHQNLSNKLAELQGTYEKKWTEYEKQRKVRVELQYKNKQLEASLYQQLYQQSRNLIFAENEPNQSLVRYNSLKIVLEEMIKNNINLQQTLTNSINELNSKIKERGGENFYDSDDDEEID